MERHVYERETGWNGDGFTASSENEAQRKEEGDRHRVRVSRAGHRGPRLKGARAETCQQSGEGVRPQVRAHGLFFRPHGTPEAEGRG